MGDEEFNLLTRELLEGVPMTMALNRLLRALRAVVDSTGEAGAVVFRWYCGERRRVDAEDYFSEGPV